MLERFVELTRALAVLSAAFLVVTSPPVRRSARAMRRSARALGFATFVSTVLVTALVALQLLLAALERRAVGPSPLESLPFVGRLFTAMARGQRLSIALILLGLVALAWSLLVRVPSDGGVVARRRLTLPLWLLWVIVSVVSTSLAGVHLESRTLALYAATVITVVAIIVSVPFIDRDVAVRSLTATFVVATAAAYAVSFSSHGWAWTSDWPGGFITGERLQGIFPQPNVAGAFYGLGILVVASRADLRWRSRAVLVAPMALLVFWSGSRGAVLLLAAGGMALTWGRGSGRRLRRLAFACAAVSVAVPVVHFSATEELFAGRTETWRLAYDIGRRSWLVGGGGFPLRSPEGGWDALYAHSQPLQTFAESGMLGVLVLAAALWHAVHARDIYVPLAGAALIGLLATFPYENPVRLFSPSFAATFVVVLILVGSGAPAEERVTGASSTSARPSARSVPG